MRILIAHNAYQQRGGEDVVVEAEAAMLQQAGHAVRLFSLSNERIVGMGRLALARETVWSRESARALREAAVAHRAELIHVHNTFPLMSPSIYWAAARAGIPVVQTLHNFRLLCLNALFMREGQVCEDCLGKLPLQGVVRGCYRDSRPASAVLGGMLALHRALGSYRNKVARFIALSEFCRDKYIEGGLPAERIVVKPNFTSVDLAPLDDGTAQNRPRHGFLFAGRLSAEKGLDGLLAAVSRVPAAQLEVAGDGPAAAALVGRERVTALGALSRVALLGAMQRALAVVVPSVWQEPFGLVVIEAFACGTPVIASRIGSLPGMVEHGRNGLLFTPGDVGALAEQLAWAIAHPVQMAEMGRRAREDHARLYTPAANHTRLMQIYRDALASRA